MSKCSVPACRSEGHNKSAHTVRCVICGFGYFVEDIVSMDREALRLLRETANCGNDARHRELRSTWDLSHFEIKEYLKRANDRDLQTAVSGNGSATRGKAAKAGGTTH